MAYDELEDRNLGMDESDMYEDETLYEPVDTFGEQIGESSDAESGYGKNDEQESSTPANQPSRVEDAFGETLSSEANPHLADQMDDSKLGEEARADYSDADLDE